MYAYVYSQAKNGDIVLTAAAWTHVDKHRRGKELEKGCVLVKRKRAHSQKRHELQVIPQNNVLSKSSPTSPKQRRRGLETKQFVADFTLEPQPPSSNASPNPSKRGSQLELILPSIEPLPDINSTPAQHVPSKRSPRPRNMSHTNVIDDNNKRSTRPRTISRVDVIARDNLLLPPVITKSRTTPTSPCMTPVHRERRPPLDLGEAQAKLNQIAIKADNAESKSARDPPKPQVDAGVVNAIQTYVPWNVRTIFICTVCICPLSKSWR